MTILAALGSQGVEAVMTIEGATAAEVFHVYVEQVLRPTLRPGDMVIMDNLRAHKVAGIREAVEQAIAQALVTITVSDAHSWFHHCGYALQ
jgi:transposase